MTFLRAWNKRKALRSTKPTKQQNRYRLQLDCLEERVTPSATVVSESFVNDNWHFVTDVDSSGGLTVGDEIRNDNDTINTGGTTAFYGINGFGVVTTGAHTSSDPGHDEITEAIDHTVVGGIVNVLEGAYTENVVVDQNVTLQSVGGRSMATITGISNGALGAIRITNSTTAVTIGGTGKGFTINGVDNPSPGIESAAVYFQGGHSGTLVQDNEIVAQGDAGLQTEFGATNSGLVIDNNEFSGQTFIGPNPAGDGFGQQFILPNVPRQLVVISGGSGGGNHSNITFTNNQITGTAGGLNASNDPQGNTLVTIDSVGATITGNLFDGTTTRFGASLRARGTSNDISGNTFLSDNLTLTNSQLTVGAATLAPDTIQDVVDNNTFDRGVYIPGGTFVALNIQGVIDNVPGGTTVIALPGTYDQSVDVNKDVTLQGTPTLTGTLTASANGAVIEPGFSAGVVTSAGLDLATGTAVDMEINGTQPGTEHDQFDVDGPVDLGGVQLDLDVTFTPNLGTQFIVIDNDDADPVVGTFDGLPEGASFTANNGQTFGVSYVGGDGNDVVLTALTGPSEFYVVGADAGATPDVRVFDATTGNEIANFLAYDSAFPGGVHVALGDVNSDGTPDIITGAGAGGGPHVKVFDGTTFQEIRSFFAYDPAFGGGVFVAAGDINGDGFADIITGAGAGGGPHVKVFDGDTGVTLRSFFAYDPEFSGGVSVGAGDFNGDFNADIITGAGPGGGPHVRIIDGVTNADIASFFAYDAAFTGGVFVAAGDFNGDNQIDLITGAGAGGGPEVRVFDGTNFDNVLASFFAYDAAMYDGVRVATAFASADNRADIIVGRGGESEVKVFDSLDRSEIDSFFAFTDTVGTFVG